MVNLFKRHLVGWMFYFVLSVVTEITASKGCCQDHFAGTDSRMPMKLRIDSVLMGVVDSGLSDEQIEAFVEEGAAATA